MQSRNIGRKKPYLGEILSMDTKCCGMMIAARLNCKPIGTIHKESFLDMKILKKGNKG